MTVFADKDRELGDAHAEIKALKYSERLKEKAVEEVLLFVSITDFAFSNEDISWVIKVAIPLGLHYMLLCGKINYWVIFSPFFLLGLK